MDYLMGIRGKDFVMVVADTTAVQQIITIKHDEEKIVPVDTDSPASSQKLLAMAGEPGDRVQVCHALVLVVSHSCCDDAAACQLDGCS
jgi:20S proteasome subunit beta 4